MSLLTVNSKLLWWYYVYYAGDGLLFSVLNIFALPLCARQQTLQWGGSLLWVVTSDPVHCHRGGGAYVLAAAQSIRLPCSEHSSQRLATGLSKCFSAHLWHWGLNWKRQSWTWTRTWRDSVCPAGGGGRGERCSYRNSSQPTCLYYIVLTRSLCVTTLFLYSSGETLLVYVFDICTNAPLWKRKWNLDISGINGQLVFLFGNWVKQTTVDWSAALKYKEEVRTLYWSLSLFFSFVLLLWFIYMSGKACTFYCIFLDYFRY